MTIEELYIRTLNTVYVIFGYDIPGCSSVVIFYNFVVLVSLVLEHVCADGFPLYWRCQCGILDHYGMWPDVSCHDILMNV